MNQLIFLTLVIGAALATPLNINRDSWDEVRKIEGRNEDCPGNQDIAAYFENKNNRVKWAYIKSKSEWEAVKAKNEPTMIVVDASAEETDTEVIIDNDFTVNNLLEEVINTPGHKIGVKFNIKNLEAFKKLPTLYDNERDEPDPIPPFPLMFHINADSYEDTGYTLIDEISSYYNEHSNKFSCYTFSFGWITEKCGSFLSEKNFETLKTHVDKFENLKHKNVDLDVFRVRDDSQEIDFVDTKTYKFNDEKLRCYSLLDLQDKMVAIEEKDKNFVDFIKNANLNTRDRLCKLDNGILKDLVGEDKDPSSAKWKLVTDYNNLENKINENFIEIEEKNGKFLDKNFNEVITKFKETQTGNKLILKLKNQEALNTFWNVEFDDLKKIEGVKLGVEIMYDLDYNENKWIDCYSAVINHPGSDNGYEEADLDELKNHAIGSSEIIYSLAIDKAAKTETDKIISLLKGTNTINSEATKALKLNMEQDTKDEEVMKARSVLLKERYNTLLDAADDVRTKIDAFVDAKTFFEGEKKDLVFKDVEKCSELGTEENVMVQVEVKTNADIEACLNKLSENDKNGLKLKVSAINQIPGAAAIKYRNYPVWVQVDYDVVDITKIDLDGHYHLVIANKNKFDLTKLKTALTTFEDKTITVALKANDYISTKEDIDTELNGKDKVDMLVFFKRGDKVVTSKLRESLKEKTNYYSDVPHKFMLTDCRKPDFLSYFDETENLEENLSLIAFSDPITSMEEMDTALTKSKHMLNFVVDSNLKVGDDLNLVDVLKTDKDDIKFGYKLTFAAEADLEAVFKNSEVFELLRNSERPVWINVEAIKNKEINFNLNYDENNDLIDCQTLSLGFAEIKGDKYSKENVDKMQGLELGPNWKVYVVDLLHIGHVWETVGKLVEGDRGNFITLLSKESDANNVDYASMETVLDENKSKFFYDFPDVVRDNLKGGSAAISASFVLSLGLACFAMVFHH